MYIPVLILTTSGFWPKTLTALLNNSMNELLWARYSLVTGPSSFGSFGRFSINFIRSSFSFAKVVCHFVASPGNASSRLILMN